MMDSVGIYLPLTICKKEIKDVAISAYCLEKSAGEDITLCLGLIFNTFSLLLFKKLTLFAVMASPDSYFPYLNALQSRG